MTDIVRCPWAETNELFHPYHDTEWGVPTHDDFKLFEMITLEGAQAGLSWLTILKKRDDYRKAFSFFDFDAVALYDEAKYESLLSKSGIVRNKLKIRSTIDNAKAIVALGKEFGSFDAYIWSFIPEKPLTLLEAKESKEISEHMSKELNRRGFRFVGPTICLAFMEATGMVNHHEKYCFRFNELTL